MQYSIDYLSFTVPFDPPVKGQYFDLGAMAEQAVSDYLGVYIHDLLDNQEFKPGAGRAPYTQSWGRADGGIRIFASSRQTNALVECSGVGCATLRKRGTCEEVLAVVVDRVSRLDVAIDISSAISPRSFVADKAHEKFKSSGYNVSQDGETCYVGAWKSDRFARVYRYNPPHPRANLLRVEHVFRRKAAKKASENLLAQGYERFAKAVGEVYGWSHPDWQPAHLEASPIMSGQMRREGNATVSWLYGAVISAVVKQAKEGKIDLNDWFEAIKTKANS